MFTALIGLAITVISSSLTMCACGHLDFSSLPGSLVGASFTWYAMFKAKDVGIFRRVVIDITCIAAILILFKNGVDIIWLGHDPLLQ